MKWIPPILYALFLSTLSHFSLPSGPGIPHLDKLMHFGAYVILGFLIGRASPRRAILLAFLAAAFHGALDEWHQSFVPGRTMELADAIADAIGGLTGGWIATLHLDKRTTEGV